MPKSSKEPTRQEQQRVRKIVEKDGTVSVTRTVLGQVTEKTDRINVRPFATEPAHVSVKYGLTLNLGQYESARVDVMVTLPCYKEEMREAYEDVRSFVEQKITEEKGKFEQPDGGV